MIHDIFTPSTVTCKPRSIPVNDSQELYIGSHLMKCTNVRQIDSHSECMRMISIQYMCNDEAA